MKFQTWGRRGRFVPPVLSPEGVVLDRLPLPDGVILRVCAAAMRDYRKANWNDINEIDEEEIWPGDLIEVEGKAKRDGMPVDGKFSLQEESLKNKGWCYARYDEGPGDRAWINEQNKKYIRELIERKMLEEREPEVARDDHQFRDVKEEMGWFAKRRQPDNSNADFPFTSPFNPFGIADAPLPYPFPAPKLFARTSKDEAESQQRVQALEAKRKELEQANKRLLEEQQRRQSEFDAVNQSLQRHQIRQQEKIVEEQLKAKLREELKVKQSQLESNYQQKLQQLNQQHQLLQQEKRELSEKISVLNQREKAMNENEAVLSRREFECTKKEKVLMQQTQALEAAKAQLHTEVHHRKFAQANSNAVSQLAGAPRVQADQLRLGKKLGSGGYGDVFEGKWHYTDVAIKQLRNDVSVTDEMLQEFESEAERHASFRHPNIVMLFGVCLEKHHYGMVMELMVQGSLHHLLHNQQPLPWTTRIRIAQDICQGLLFLHSQQPPVIHRDLKSLNVLLDGALRAKLSDFGLSKIKTSSLSMSNGPKGTFLWMAPELYDEEGKYTEHSDIYSLGVVLWEIASRELPHKTCKNPMQLCMRVAKKGLRDEIPQDTPTEVSKLISRCWAQRCEDRPDSTEVAQEIMSVKLP